MLETIEITCPKCHKKFKQKIGGTQGKKEFPCPKCGALFDASEVKRGLKKAEKDIDKLTRDIGKMFK